MLNNVLNNNIIQIPIKKNMSFKVNTKNLLEALQKTVKVVPSRSTLPILGCSLFDFSNQKMILKATNLETSISESIEIVGEMPESPIAIPIGRLLEITNNISDKEIELNITEKQQLEIKTKTGSFSIMGQDHSEYPSDPIMNETQSIYIKTSTLFEIIDFTKNSTSKDELKPALQGVLLKIDGKSIVGVSTDGHRLSRIIIENEGLENQEQEIIIPTKFLTLLTSFVDKKENAEIEISKNHMSLSYKNTTIYSRIIKDNYPDYEKVIPLDNNKTFTTNKKDLINAIKRVSIFSNRSTKQITLDIGNQKTTISTEDSEQSAKGAETISSQFNNMDNLKIGFNSMFILDALNSIKSEQITMFLNGSLNAAILSETSPDKKMDKLVLLMPIRLND
ncbi:MAG: DNA polymerase III subunit beta [Candidatus Marinimicrobia bacterium]|nr:DNA polymerase III subunit beta [Candidatus Neomarinimicrobiota bacterium]